MLSYASGKPLARISYKDLEKVLKYEDEEDDLDVFSEESIKQFGHKKPMLSLTEKMLSLSPEDLSAALNADPKLKKRLKNEVKNHKVPAHFTPQKGSEKDYFIEKVEIINSKFIPAINPKDFREIIYIYGPSGAGKSTICRAYIDEYQNEFPFNKVYLFSLKPDDVTLNDKEVVRIPNQLDILANIDIETLKDSLVIFDDCEGYDKAVTNELKEIYRIQDNIAQIARDRRIFCIVTTHIACQGNKTKIILNECHKIITFPGRVPKRALDYLMETYGGMNKKEINQLTKLKSRWVCLNKEYPRYIMHKDGLYTI